MIDINIGTGPNTGNGDPLRTSFNISNLNDQELNANKVDKVTGKGLSTEDFTTAEKVKLAALTFVPQVFNTGATDTIGAIQAIQTGSTTSANFNYSFALGLNAVANAEQVNVLGSNITGSTSATTYVDYLNIGRFSPSAITQNLGIDSAGNVVIGTIVDNNKEDKANKQNAFAPYNGTGLKYPTLDLVNATYISNAKTNNTTGFVSKTDTMELSALTTTTLRITATNTNGVFFVDALNSPTAVYSDAFKTFPQTDYDLANLVTASGSNVNVNPIVNDGLYVRFIGYNINGGVVSSATNFKGNTSVAQLGYVAVTKVGATVSFTSGIGVGGINVFSQPFLSSTSALDQDTTKLTTTVSIGVNAAPTLNNTAGVVNGVSVNWHQGTGNTNNTTSINERSVQSNAALPFISIDKSTASATTAPTVLTSFTQTVGGIQINESFFNTTTGLRGTLDNNTFGVKQILLSQAGRFFIKEGQFPSTMGYATMDAAKAAVGAHVFDTSVLPVGINIEIGRVCYKKGATDFTNVTEFVFIPSAMGGGGGASTVQTVVDATTSTKGIIQLAGDISGTATNVIVTRVNSGTPYKDLTTGILKNTTGTGQHSIATANVDYTTPAFVEGKITQTITNGNTGQTPSSDAVFDALSGKQNTIIGNPITGQGIGTGGTAGYLARFTGTTQIGNSALYQATNGYVSFGRTTPASQFEVYNGGDAVYSRIIGVSDGDNYGALELWNTTSSSKWQFAHKSIGGQNKDFAFMHYNGTSWLNPMQIKDNGNVLINSTTDNATGAKFQVTGNATISGNLTGATFVKQGAAPTNILLANGTDIPQSTFATASGNGNYIQNQKIVAQTADYWINGTGKIEGNVDVGSSNLTEQLKVNGNFIVNGFTKPVPTTADTQAGNIHMTVNDAAATGIGGRITAGPAGGVGPTAAYGSINIRKASSSTASTSGYITFETNQGGSIGNKEVMRITNAGVGGNVGISTTAPSTKLHVFAGTSGDSALITGSVAYFEGVNAGVIIGQHSTFSRGTWMQSVKPAGGTVQLPLNLNPMGASVIVGNLIDNTVDKLQVNGSIIASSLKKSGATASNILLAGGADIPQSTFALASGDGNYIQNQNVSPQTANSWISGTTRITNEILAPVKALHITTINGADIYAIYSQGGLNYFQGEVLIGTDNNVTGAKLQVNGNADVFGRITNPYLSFYNNRIEEYVTDSDTAEVSINFEGYAGNSRYRNFTVYDGKYNPILNVNGSTSATTFNGNVSAKALIKQGAPATNILLADGSDIPQSGFVNGSGTINTFPLWIGTNFIGNSIMSYDTATFSVKVGNGAGDSSRLQVDGLISSTGFKKPASPATNLLIADGGDIAQSESAVDNTIVRRSGSGLAMVSGGYLETTLANTDAVTLDTFATFASASGVIRKSSAGAVKAALGLSNGIVGTLSTNYIPKATGANSLGNSQISDNGSNIQVGATSNYFNKFGVTYASAIGDSSANGVAFQTDDVGDYIQFYTNAGSYSAINAGLRGSGSPRNLILNQSAGNVGVGTTSPQSRLEAYAGVQSDSIVVGNSAAYFRGADVGTMFGQFAGNGSYASWMQSVRNYDNAPFSLAINPSGGNVLINKIADNTVDKLQVNGTIEAHEAVNQNQVVTKSQLDRKVNNIYVGNPPDYERNVILLHRLDNSNIGATYEFNGQVFIRRFNGLYAPIIIDVTSQKAYNSDTALGHSSIINQAGLVDVVTFNYNGIKWLGAITFISDATAGVNVSGDWTETPILVPYYNNSTLTVINNEIYSSLASYSHNGYQSFNGNVTVKTITAGSAFNLHGALGGSVGNGGTTIKMVDKDSGNYASISSGVVGVTNGGMQFSTDGTSRMIISAAGNVVVGSTTDSGHKFRVAGGGGYFEQTLVSAGAFFADGGISVGTAGNRAGVFAGTVNAIAIGDNDTGILQGGDGFFDIYSNGIFCSRHSNGRLLVGDGADNGSDRLQVHGGSKMNGSLTLTSEIYFNTSNSYLRGVNVGGTGYRPLIGLGGASSAAPDRVIIDADAVGSHLGGPVRLANLAGTNTRTVVADANGNLGTIETVSGVQVAIVEGGWGFNNSCVVATGIPAGKTILNITSTLKCIATWTTWQVGDIASISPTQPVDSGGLDDSGITVRWRADDSTKFTFVVNNRLDLGEVHNGGVGTCANTGNPTQVDNVHFNIRHVIMYI